MGRLEDLFRRTRVFENTAYGYLAALALTGLAISVRLALTPVSSGLPFILVFLAVMLSGLVGGAGPGILATVLGGTAGYLLLPPELALDPLGEISAMLLFLLGAVPIVLIVHALRRGIARLIEEKERNRVLLSRNEVLLSELNHRVKNNMQVVVALLTLQAKKAPPAVREQLFAAARRVQIMGQVHQRLYGGRERHQPTPGEFLKELCADLSASSGSGHEIVCTLDGTDLRMSPDQAIPLALIVNELMSNVFKHAYAEGIAGKVHLDLRREGADRLRLSVTDEGRGLPDDFDPEQASGLGMKIVAALVQQLGGTIAFERQPAGTRVSLLVPTAHADT